MPRHGGRPPTRGPKVTMTLRALLNVAIMAGTTIALHKTFTQLAGKDSYLYWFLALSTWRYLRFFVNLAAFWCYSPSKPRSKPTYTPSKDVTAVIPTVAPDSPDVKDTIRCCAENAPASIILVTPGDDLVAEAHETIAEFTDAYPAIKFLVFKSHVVSKRAQVAAAVPHIKTDITVLLDDHVFWGPRFLQTMLYPFEDPNVGLVGTNKRVIRADGLGLWGRIWNMLGATYLCRHNFEIRATNAVDGGVFVISGRTCAIRTDVLQHPDFLPGYTNEMFFFGLFGPLNPDDDNYITRFIVRHGWKIKIQYTDETIMQTKLGVEKPLHTKFLGQCRRWVRTTWRSNLCSLITDRTVWATQPYCVYAVYLTSLTNFAAVTDPLLVYLFVRSSAYTSALQVAGLVYWILLTKTVKVFDYFRRNPQDIVLFPVYVAFAYFHSLIKFWALLTFWDCAWCGRRLDEIKVDGDSSSAESDENAYSGPEHPHVSALRAVRARLTKLQKRLTAHVRGYQRPVLDELKNIQESFKAVQKEHTEIRNNMLAIQQQLTDVALKAQQVGNDNDLPVAADADVAKKIEAIKVAVIQAEQSWNRGVEDKKAERAEFVGSETESETAVSSGPDTPERRVKLGTRETAPQTPETRETTPERSWEETKVDESDADSNKAERTASEKESVW